MKILILHVANTYNYGTMMMAQNLINELNKNIVQNVSFYVDIKTEDNLTRLKEATGINNIYIDTKMDYNPKGNKIIRKLKQIINIKKHAKQVSDCYDKIIFLGGDDFSEIYSTNFKARLSILLYLKKVKYLNSNKNVILLGQTIGPYTGIRKIYAKKALKNIKIITRDTLSHEIMKNEYNINSEISTDLALLDLNMQQEYISKADEILKKYNLEENEYITIVGTQLLKLYTKNEELFVKTFFDIIKNIQDKYPKKKIVWLSHVLTPAPSRNDNYLLDAINKITDNYINQNLTIINTPVLPVEARIILGYGYLTLTCRMHAAVSTLQMGKPAICLSYSPKYKGVIGQSLGMNDLIIEAKNDKIWEEEIIALINDKIEYIDKNYKQITTNIKNNVNKAQKQIEESIKKLIQKS